MDYNCVIFQISCKFGSLAMEDVIYCAPWAPYSILASTDNLMCHFWSPGDQNSAEMLLQFSSFVSVMLAVGFLWITFSD